MKMCYAYFQNCAFRALDIASTLDAPVLFVLVFPEFHSVLLVTLCE